MKKLLSVLGSIGIIGTTGSTIVACGNKDKDKPKENPIEISKKELKGTIDQAHEANTKHQKAPSAHERLTTEIEIAEELWARENVIHEDLLQGNVRLKTEVNIFINSDDLITIVKNELNNKIEEANSLIAENEKIDEAINKLKDSVKTAQTALNNPQITIEELKNHIQLLDEAINIYQKAKNKLDVAKEELEKVIREAETINKDYEKTEEAHAALELSINQAKAELKNEKATADSLKAQIETLKRAIETFKTSRNLTPKETLQKRINQAEELVKSNEKVEDAIETLKIQIDEAKKILQNPNVNDVEINDAVNKLEQAIEKYNEAEDNDPRGILGPLLFHSRLILSAAKTAGNKTPEEINKFETAILKTEKILENEKVHDNELRMAIKELIKAINEFGV